MQSIGVSELRANLLKLHKRVEKGTTFLITSRGRVVAKIVPAQESVQEAEKKLTQVRETAKIYDIVTPIGEEWEAEH